MISSSRPFRPESKPNRAPKPRPRCRSRSAPAPSTVYPAACDDGSTRGRRRGQAAVSHRAGPRAWWDGHQSSSLDDRRTGRHVARKRLVEGEVEVLTEDRVRFEREALVHAQLEHPSIVPVYDIGRDADGTVYFTMKRIEGDSLASILAERLRGEGQRYTRRRLLAAFSQCVPRRAVRARAWRHPSRHQAGEHHARPLRRGVSPRLGRRESAGGRRPRLVEDAIR